MEYYTVKIKNGRKLKMKENFKIIELLCVNYYMFVSKKLHPTFQMIRAFSCIDTLFDDS